MQAKKLIEVAMSIKEISAESVRDKSIRHGHISTLHLWWARRPLPVCRAVVFASLVPDPEDKNCPQAFKDACQVLLGEQFALNDGGIVSDWYKPYDDIPYTSAIDKMEDTLRNRLLMFIGKFSEKYIQAAKQGETAAAKDMLSDASLIKWDNKNDDIIIGKARKLIWVAHNSASGKSAEELLADFDTAFKAIKTAENELYGMADRHIASKGVQAKEATLQFAIDSFQDKMPKVFDPFAGGGAIPLEAARLGCKTYGNDINPVAHIIQKGSLEFPQKFGKPITYSKKEFINIYGQDEWNKLSNENLVYKNGEAIAVVISNRLSFDVEFYAKKLLRMTESEIGYLYPANEGGNKPIAYYWARVGTCINPSCQAKIPLLRQFYLANTNTNHVYLNPIVERNQINFEVKNGKCQVEGWIDRGNLKCPCCGNITNNSELKKQLVQKENSDRLIAVIENNTTGNGKKYRIPDKKEFITVDIELNEFDKPKDKLPVSYTKAMAFCLWGYDSWGDIFSDRQIKTISNIIKCLDAIRSSLPHESEYYKAVVTYLSILIDRIAIVNTSFGRWNVSGEKLEHPFARQAIQMVFDYPESNPFCGVTGSALNQLEWIIRYIESESNNIFHSKCINASSGDKGQFTEKFIDAVITDPPYYDAIAYADLSDFFYIWLKRTLGTVFPLNFATPQTPKTEECTALKHHHNESLTQAKHHFENKLTQIFDAIEHQTSDIVSIMFAHQSTEAWTTLCNSILSARMNITGSWAIDTEMSSRAVGLAGAALESSVTVSCRPAQRKGHGDYKSVKKAIEIKVVNEVEGLYKLGFRGADLLTACFGQAVSEFGKYEKVEKANGSEVTVAELLEMARESAFNALLKGFDGDDFTKFYIGWLQLYGFVESDFDDAAKFSRVGLSINVQDLFTDHILIKNGNKQALGSYKERLAASKNLGEKANSHLIDQVHRAMFLYQGTNRGILLEYIHRVASNPDSTFWRVLTSLCEISPVASDDHKQATGLITNKESLIRESATAQRDKGPQPSLFE